VAWLSGWTYRKKFTPPRSASALSNVPLILQITDDADIGAGAAFADCRDFRITRADGTTLVDPLRVTAPAISGGVCNGLLHVIGDVSAVVDEPLYLYYGAAAASAPWVTSLAHTGCAGWWGMESTSWPDWSGEGTPGTSEGAITTTTGVLGDAADFDGDAAAIDLGTIGSGDPLMLNGSDVTIVAWVWLDGTGDAYQRVIDKSSSGSGIDGYSVYLGPSPSAPTLSCAVNGAVSVATSSTVATGSWVRLCLVHRHNSTAGAIYFNGIAQPVSSNARPIPDVSANCKVGTWNRPDIAGRELHGLLDDLRVYSRAWSDDEAAYDAALPGSPGTWGAEETAPVTSRPWLWARGQRIIGGGVI